MLVLLLFSSESNQAVFPTTFHRKQQSSMLTEGPQASFHLRYLQELHKRVANEQSYAQISTLTLSTGAQAKPSTTLMGVTKSLVMASLKGVTDKNITQVSDVATIALTSHVTIGVHTILGIDVDYVTKVFGLSSSVHHFVIERMDRPVADCWMGSVFEYYDVVVTTDQYFGIMLRQNRDCFISKLKWTTINSTDLNMAYMGPFELLSYNSTASYDPIVQSNYLTSVMFNYMYSFNQMISIPVSMCNQQYIVHDWAVLRAGQGLMNISESDLVLVNSFFQNKMTINRAPYEMALQKLQTNLTISVYSQLNVEMALVVNSVRANALYPSYCYSCKTTQCMWEDVNNPVSATSDAISYGVIVFFVFQCVVYWPVFIYFRNREAVKRRLILPYLNGITSTIIMLFQIFQVDKSCYLLHQIVIYFCSCLSLIVYSAIVSRFILLRYLYKILKYCNESQAMMVKRLSSKWFVIVVSLALGCIIGLIVALVPIAGYSRQFYGYSATYVSAILLTVVNLTIAAVALIAIIVNVALSYKVIWTRGWMYFLFFDDPMSIRYDFVFLIIRAVIVSCSLFLTELSTSNVFNGIGPSVVYFFGYCSAGGGAILVIEIVTSFIYKASPKVEEKTIEKKMENQDFYNLIKEYASKEYSLENIMLYDKMKDLKRKSNDSNPRLSISDLEDIQNTFLRSLSRHEINLPNETKQSFETLLKNCKENKTEVRFRDVYNILYVDLMHNIADTSFRLVKTKEYSKWELANKIYKQEAHASQ